MTTSRNLLLPGQPLSGPYNDTKYTLGKGCVRVGGKVLATVVGVPYKEGDVVGVRGREEGNVVPYIGAIVIGTVTRLLPTSLTLHLLSLPPHPLPPSSAGDQAFSGTLKLSDIRLVDKDRVKVGECFRGGDMVRARVIGLGDGRSYFLSTAGRELGVVEAVSEAGNPMQPVSWEEMLDPITGLREKRKVADPNATE